jgi:hypothetical protein
MRSVQKIADTGEPPRFTAYLVRDKENGPVEREGSVSPMEAERLVASGDWRFVEARVAD